MFYFVDIMCGGPTIYITHVSDLTIMMASSTMSPVSDSQDQEFMNKAMDSKIRTGLEEMRLARMFCDITLVAGNVDIPAHKNILASSSPYFLALLNGSFMENNGFRITIKDVNPDILTLLVEYIYTSKLMITLAVPKEGGR